MTIFTISFTGRSTKTYDYIVFNPNHYDVDVSKLLKFVISVDHHGPRYSAARVVKVSHPDSLPYQVTTCLDVNAGNVVVSRKLDDVQLAKLRALKPAPAATKSVVSMSSAPAKTPAPTEKPTEPHILTEQDKTTIAFYEAQIRRAEEEERQAQIRRTFGYPPRPKIFEIVIYKRAIQKIKEGTYNYERL